MKWCLTAMTALAIAGVAAYGPRQLPPVHAAEVRVEGPAAPVQVPAAAAPAVAAVERPVKERAPSTVSAAPGSIAMRRGGEVIGWVKPDPARVKAEPAPARRASRPSPAEKVRTVGGESLRMVKDGREGGSVWRIKSEFRDAGRQRFYQKPPWARGGWGREFSDRPDQR